MKSILIILFLLLVGGYGFGQEPCDSAYLNIGSETYKLEPLYLLEDEFGDPIEDTEDTIKTNFIYKLDNSYNKIKVYPHTGYIHLMDENEFGDPVKIEISTYIEDSMSVSKYMGAIEKETLLEQLLLDMFITDCQKKIPIENNYYVYISTKDSFKKISKAELDYYSMMKIEFKSLEKGDLIITGYLNYKNESLNHIGGVNIVGAIYWTIK